MTDQPDTSLNVPGSKFTPDDPCSYCKQLKEARRNIITGGAKSQIQYLAGGVTRMVAYSKPDLAELNKEIAQAEKDCAAAVGLPAPRRRFAIQAGSFSDDYFGR